MISSTCRFEVSQLPFKAFALLIRYLPGTDEFPHTFCQCLLGMIKTAFCPILEVRQAFTQLPQLSSKQFERYFITHISHDCLHRGIIVVKSTQTIPVCGRMACKYD